MLKAIAQDIVTTRKDANKVYYRIGDTKILKLIGSLREAFCERQRQAGFLYPENDNCRNRGSVRMVRHGNY